MRGRLPGLVGELLLVCHSVHDHAMHAMYFPARACRLLATQSRPNTTQQNNPQGAIREISPLNADPLHHDLPDSNGYINLTAALRRYICSTSCRDAISPLYARELRVYRGLHLTKRSRPKHLLGLC